MADRKQQLQQTSKIDALYSWLSYDLQRMKGELINELKYSSVQIGSLYQEMKADKASSAQAITQEIRFSYKQNQNIYDGLASMLTQEVGDRMDSMDEKLSSIEQIRALNEELNALVGENVLPQVDTVSAKLALLEKIEEMLVAINEAIAALPSKETIDEAISAIPVNEVDYNKIINGSAEKVIEAMPYPEKVDYNRISDFAQQAVGSAVEKVLSALNADSLSDVVAAKVAEIAPQIDYAKVAEVVTEKVASTVPQIDYDKLADALSERVKASVPQIDYDKLADVVVAKLAGTEQSYEVVLDDEGIEKVAAKVSEKLSVRLDSIETAESIDYDRVCQAAQAGIVMPDSVDYDRIAEIVDEKLAENDKEPTYDLVIDKSGIEAIATGVAEKLGNVSVVQKEILVTDAAPETVVEAKEEEPIAEEVVEAAPVEEPIVEEPIAEEPVEELPQEEVIAEEPIAEEEIESASDVIEEEIAVAEPVVVYDPAAEMETKKEIAFSVVSEYQEIDNQLVDAETGLVIRLKRSFTAKMRQSDEKVKGYYSDIKNELTSYKRINSNVSWHGDRFNLGRDTIAKINICGKTLCFYLALDPNDPEFKSTVYHQKDVGDQKAYELTPFLVKVKSDAAAKKALRLVGFLAEKVNAEKDESFKPVDYVEEFKYQSTKQLFEDGFIKVTKEKKVDLDF